MGVVQGWGVGFVLRLEDRKPASYLFRVRRAASTPCLAVIVRLAFP